MDSGIYFAFGLLGVIGLMGLIGLLTGRAVGASFATGLQIVRGSEAVTFNLVYLVIAIAGALVLALAFRT